ncbi:MAG: DNA-directed RNA polymerase subunit omega [Bryobacteraceae bacterium]
MPESTHRDNLIAIPDDPEQSTYRFIIVAAKRARQLQSGQRPLLPTASKKPTVTAMEEVRRGLVKWEDPARQPKRAEEPAEEKLLGGLDTP